MGELDEAIREHLELKRRRGADPAEVAREEQEALAPVTRGHRIVVPDELDEEDLHATATAANGGRGYHEDSPRELAPSEHEDAGDETQEFRVVFGSGDDWLEDEDEGES